MNDTEAHEILTEVTSKVDFLNLGGIISQLGEQGFQWGKFNNHYQRFNYSRAYTDMKWLTKNLDRVNTALDYLRDTRPSLNKNKS